MNTKAEELKAVIRALRANARKDAVEIERLTSERDEAREALREIQASDWKTSGELRGMARKALESRQ